MIGGSDGLAAVAPASAVPQVPPLLPPQEKIRCLM